MDSTETVPPFRSALDTIPLAVGVLDSAGEIVFLNRAWRKIGGDTGSVFQTHEVGTSYLDGLSDADDETAQTAAAGVSELLAGDRSSVELEYAVDGRWFLLWAGLCDSEERTVVVTHREITERVEIAREQARFKQAVENAGHAIMITTVDGEITYVNPAFEEITGYGRQEALGQTPRLLKSNEMDAAFYTELWETILSGEIWKGTIVNRRKSGELYYAQQTVAPLLRDDREPTHFVAIQTDITEVREKRKQIEKLETIFRHDLRNRINVAKGYADLLKDHGNHETNDYLTTLTEALDELLSSVEKARHLQSILSTETSPEPRNVAEICRDVVAAQQTDHPAATIRFDGSPEAIGLCITDLALAIEELIVNSVTHSDVETPEIVVSTDVSDEWTEIRVADNGPGIPDMESEPLETNVMSQLYHDTGFGLNQVYWIVRRSGGRLLFADNTPRGSVVRIQLLAADD